MTDHYTLPHQILHWLIGLLIIALLCVGLYMTDLPATPDKFAIYGLHKAFGMTVLGLVILRVFTRLAMPVPPPLASHATWEITLARITHATLYLAMILMPLSGWAMSSAGGHPVSWFGLTVPPLVGENKELGQFMRSAHSTIAYTLIGAIALHVAGVIKHVVIDRDRTLSRMVPGMAHKKDGNCTTCQGGN
ncbi:MAG: cytochrome b [Pseudomonadota bacterium]